MDVTKQMDQVGTDSHNQQYRSRHRLAQQLLPRFNIVNVIQYPHDTSDNCPQSDSRQYPPVLKAGIIAARLTCHAGSNMRFPIN